MGFFKKYLSLMVPVAVTLVAVLLLTVSLMMAQSLQEQLQESISMGRRIESYKGQNISASQWKLEREYQQAHGRDANEISVRAKESSQRELLSYKIFPEPKETSAQIFNNFGQEYRNAIENLIKDISALDAPTEAELNSLLQQPTTEADKGRGAGFAGREMRTTETRAGTGNPIIELIYRQRAETIPIYGNPARLSGYQFWDKFTYAGRQDAIEKCWYSQISFWIQKDIIDSIKVMNAGSSSVLTSPVKRLVGISFTGPADSDSLAVEDMPIYVTSIRGLTTPWTGRICNDNIDVVHFNVTVVISPKAILEFMQELCTEKKHLFSGFLNEGQTRELKHNQITILESSVNPVDRTQAFSKGYYYGDDAITQLNLVCEYVFNRAGYDEIKPKSIKLLLGQMEEKAEDTASTQRRGRRRTR